MEDQLFEVGQAITLLEDGPWYQVGGGHHVKYFPKFGEIYHVKDYDGMADGTWFIRLNEIAGHMAFDQHDFAPVISDKELEDALEEVTLQTV